MGGVIRVCLYVLTLLTWAAALGAMCQWSSNTGNLAAPALFMGLITLAVTPTIAWTTNRLGHAAFGLTALTPYIVAPGPWIALPLGLLGVSWVFRITRNTKSGVTACPASN